MAQVTVDYLASRRVSELWSPVPFTNNLQIWSSLSAFGLAIFALFYNYLWKWASMYNVNLPNVYAIPTETASSLLGTSVWGYIMLGIIAFGGLVVFVFCIGSLAIVIIRAFRHQREVIDSTNIPDRIKAGMTKDELAKMNRINTGGVQNGRQSNRYNYHTRERNSHHH